MRVYPVWQWPLINNQVRAGLYVVKRVISYFKKRAELQHAYAQCAFVSVCVIHCVSSCVTFTHTAMLFFTKSEQEDYRLRKIDRDGM